MILQAMSVDSSDSDADDFDLLEERRNRDGTLASGTAAELRLERELAKDPWGRFGGRNGKLARIRAQEAMLSASPEGIFKEPAHPEPLFVRSSNLLCCMTLQIILPNCMPEHSGGKYMQGMGQPMSGCYLPVRFPTSLQALELLPK